jgi:putative ABC transport system permease protein
MEPFGQGFFINPDETIFINTLAGQSLTRQQTFSGIFVVARSAEDVDLVINSIQERYGRGLRVFASSTFLNSIRSVNEGISTILTSVAFMAVIVAFIGIMTTMFTSVAERTREIGILKSVGFRKRHIMGIFLAESSLTGLLGGIVGVGFGIVLSYLVIGIFGGNLGVGGSGFGRRSGNAPPALDITPVITPELLIGTVLLALGIGALAGILPAWRASKLIPVEALKHE